MSPTSSDSTSLRIGAHTSIAGGLHKALERGAEAGCDVIQIFTGSNQRWAVKPLTDADVAKWEESRARTGVEPTMVHGSYLVNLAATTAELRDKSYRAFAEEYRRCARLRIPYLVIHPGAHLGDGEATAIARIATSIDRLHAEQPNNPTAILLENTAGQGTNVGYRFEHLRDLFAAVRAPGRLGVCIDTCHTLAAGYDIRTAEGWTRTIDELDRVIGCERVRAFHVNDSKTALGSRVDRHQHLGCGELGLTALHCLVNDARFAAVPMAIETPKPVDADPVNLAVLRALHGIARVGARARDLAGELAARWVDAKRPKRQRA